MKAHRFLLVVLVAVSEATTDHLEITPDEFEEKFSGAEVFTVNLMTLLSTINPRAMSKVSEVLRTQCMHNYCVDYVMERVKFSSETDAITCSAMLEVLT